MIHLKSSLFVHVSELNQVDVDVHVLCSWQKNTLRISMALNWLKTGHAIIYFFPDEKYNHCQPNLVRLETNTSCVASKQLSELYFSPNWGSVRSLAIRQKEDSYNLGLCCPDSSRSITLTSSDKRKASI